MLGGRNGKGDVPTPMGRLDLGGDYFESATLGVRLGDAATTACAFAVNYFYLIAFAHPQHTHAVLRLFFAEALRCGYIGFVKTMHFY